MGPLKKRCNFHKAKRLRRAILGQEKSRLGNECTEGKKKELCFLFVFASLFFFFSLFYVSLVLIKLILIITFRLSKRLQPAPCIAVIICYRSQGKVIQRKFQHMTIFWLSTINQVNNTETLAATYVTSYLIFIVTIGLLINK